MTPYLIFLFAGFSAVVIQTLFIREMLVVFQGNELSVGIILSQWLVGTAIGNFAVVRLSQDFPSFAKRGEGRFFQQQIPPAPPLSKGEPKTSSSTGAGSALLASSYMLSAVVLFIVFFLTRDLRNLLHIFPGEGISLKVTYFSSLVFLVPLAAVTGAQFTLAFSHIKKDYPPASGYLFESAGYFAGGIVFTYLVLPFFTPSAVMMFLCALLFTAGAFAISKPYLRKMLFLLAALIVFSLPWVSKYFENFSLTKLYSGFNILKVVYSPYTQIVSAERNGEIYVFSNGMPILTLPNPDTEKAEKFTHLPLLFHHNPKNILILGGAAKFIQPALNHKVLSIDYAEPDPSLVGTLQELWPGNFSDARLKTQLSDGRQFLSRTEDNTYDAILMGVPYPLSLPLNRYYTLEFFTLAKKKLSRDGIIALSLPGSLVYVSAAMAELNAVVKKTVDKAFPYSMIIPGDENMIIASSSPLCEKATLKYRFKKFNPKTMFLSEKFIDYSLDPQKTQWLENEIRKYGVGRPRKQDNTFGSRLSRFISSGINRDFYPSAMTAALIWWQSIFAPNTAYAYAFIARYFWFLFLIPILWFSSGRIGPKGTAFGSGFCAMGLQMVSIWGLQVSRGNMYQLIGLLGAVFMAGTALGAAMQQVGEGKWEMKNNYIKIHSIFPFYLLPSTFSLIAVTEVLFCFWILVWMVMLNFSQGGIVNFMALSAGTGFLLGFQFPALVGHATEKTGNSSAGSIYAFDLFGGWLAAMLIGTLLIPAGGFLPAMAFLLSVKLASAYWWNRS